MIGMLDFLLDDPDRRSSRFAEAKSRRACDHAAHMMRPLREGSRR
jgi:hypothetical protein